jgi:LAO/AO transport system kinase
VGQSEFEVADMVDFFLVLMLPNAGDELQGIKKGILELADALVINKADGDHLAQATNAMAQYQSALHLTASQSPWIPKVLTCSALVGTGLEDIHKMINDYKLLASQSAFLAKKRMSQNKNWFLKLLQNKMQLRLEQNTALQEKRKDLEKKVLTEKLLPLTAATEYLDLVFNHFRAGK